MVHDRGAVAAVASDEGFEASHSQRAADLHRGDYSFDSADIEKMVDRLAVGLRAQSALVRELDSAHALLAARQVELEAARAKAELAAETLSTFLHALGHDLRAPLVSIDANLQLLDVLRVGDGNEQVAQCTADMRRTCDHGLALIRDLFDLIRSDAGQWRVLRTPVALDELVKDVCAVASTHAHANGLRIETVWNTDRGEVIDTDGTRLRQAVTNLLVNAAKFGERGVIRLTLSRRSSEDLEITVADQGRGIDAAVLPTIFEPFTRGATGHANSESGAGLGLAIVRRCARLLGGEVTAHNASEGGAVFTLRVHAPVTGCVLPVRGDAVKAAREDGIKSAATAAVTAAATPAVKPLASLRVLIVDDAADAARLLGHHLRLLGAESAVADSLVQARERLATQHFDLIIADLNLQDGSGLDLRGGQHLPVCISSATPLDELPPAARADFLSKPISSASVCAAVLTVRARVST